MLVSRAGATWCALPVSHVEEIVRPTRVEPLRAGHPAILGITLLRGRPTPVIDLGLLLGGAPCFPPRRLVCLRVAPPRGVALAVDEVAGLVGGLALEDAPPLLAGAAEGVVAALGRLDARLVALLDRARVVELAERGAGAS